MYVYFRFSSQNWTFFSSLYLMFNIFILSFAKQADEYDHCYSFIFCSFVPRNYETDKGVRGTASGSERFSLLLMADLPSY